MCEVLVMSSNTLKAQADDGHCETGTCFSQQRVLQAYYSTPRVPVVTASDED